MNQNAPEPRNSLPYNPAPAHPAPMDVTNTATGHPPQQHQNPLPYNPAPAHPAPMDASNTATGHPPRQRGRKERKGQNRNRNTQVQPGHAASQARSPNNGMPSQTYGMQTYVEHQNRLPVSQTNYGMPSHMPHLNYGIPVARLNYGMPPRPQPNYMSNLPCQNGPHCRYLQLNMCKFNHGNYHRH